LHQLLQHARVTAFRHKEAESAGPAGGLRIRAQKIGCRIDADEDECTFAASPSDALTKPRTRGQLFCRGD
jgi:hypothetical protein